MPELAGVTHRHVDAGQVRLHVAEAGEGSPVFLLHGWPQNWWAWRRVIPALVEHHRVICPDFRGYGWSDAPRDGYEKDRWADDVLALADELGLERFGLVGHDWGCVVGFRLCLRRPQRVSAFLAMSGGHPFMRPRPDAVLDLWRLGYQFVLAAPVLGQRAMEPIVRRVAGAQSSWSDYDGEVFAGQFSEPARAHAAVLTYRTFLTRELLGMAVGARDTLTTPTVYMQGERDPVVRPSMLGGYKERAPRMRVKIVPGVGHFLPEEAPGLVSDCALELLDPAYDAVAAPEPAR